MIGPFNYKEFLDGYLLTNERGSYAYLTENDFRLFINSDKSMDTDLWEDLRKTGFCYSDSIESFIRLNKDAIRDANSYLLSGTNLFIIAVTNACNNRCLYCQANGMKKIHNMSIEVAEKILQRIKGATANEITIEFQGGEPLYNFPVIKYMVERGYEVLSNKKVHYTVVSNLALLNESIASFFADNHVAVSTSIDGPEFLHDQNRPTDKGKGSYHDTLRGIELLRSKGIYPGAIQTTTSSSLSYAPEIVKEYIKLGFSQIFLRPLTRLGAASRRWDEVGYSAERFLAFYRTAMEHIINYNKNGIRIKEYHASLFLTKILKERSVNYMELRSPCGACLGQVAFTANGNVYTCDEGRMLAEMGDESFCLGNVFENSYNDWINSPVCEAVCSASLLETLPGCCDCVYKPYCGVCPVVNYTIHGNITHVSSERCKIYKGILDILFEYLINGDEYVLRLFDEWGSEA